MRAVKFAAEIADEKILIVKSKYNLTVKGEKMPDVLKVNITAEDVLPTVMNESTKTLVFMDENLYGFEAGGGLFEKDIVGFKDKEERYHAGEVIFDGANGLYCLKTCSGAKYPLYAVHDMTVLGSALLGDKPEEFEIIQAEDTIKITETAAKDAETKEKTTKGVYDIYTDGSCLGNPGACGSGFVVLDGRGVQIEERSIPIGNGTNNIAEITAAIEALSYAKEQCLPGEINFFSDSEYLIKGITTWSESWKKNGWKTSSGGPVKNADLWKKLLMLYEEAKELFEIRFTWVKGHDDNFWNEKADALACAAASEAARLTA
ncbi:MAG: ribonuclease HI [Anaerolineaceae bacterium]|nr:ribonuclease HI [Anaerolineaceae bacterium]